MDSTGVRSRHESQAHQGDAARRRHPQSRQGARDRSAAGRTLPHRHGGRAESARAGRDGEHLRRQRHAEGAPCGPGFGRGRPGR
uniref:LigA n=1 Tax=Parastrongyloides trichosuri TaxID=131310 RepID=A0A0N4ZIZ1_PARTI